MRPLKKTLSLFAVLALCLVLLPASAQFGIEGVWQAYDASGSVVMIFGATGAYITILPVIPSGSNSTFGMWMGNGWAIDAGLYSIQGMYLSMKNRNGFGNVWRYSLTGNMLYLLQEQTGIYLSMTRVSLSETMGMGGEWLEVGGEFSLTVNDDGSFIQDYGDGKYYKGVWMVYSGFLTLSYDDGDAYLLQYKLGSSSLELYDQDTGAQLASLVRSGMEETTMPAVTPAPKFSTGPAIQTPVPAGTEALLAPQTDEPAPQTNEPAPQTDEPAPQTDEPALQTDEPAAEATEAPAPDIAAAPTEAPYVAPGLAGKWQAKDAAGTRIILLTPEGLIEISYEEAELADRAKKGTFTSSADTIVITYEDGTVETFRYILMGDNLLLSDENLQNPITYARQPAED